ncbi:MAG: 7,8-dihydroneopterin aldolase/epimerase/oxygenase [Verrucomicrobiota bacterium]|jgi:dihydroneopterin aldolase
MEIPDKIIIADLEVLFQVGITEQERAQPQRLLISVEMDCDFTTAAARDNLADTIDYAAVTDRLLHFGNGCHWELIETLGAEIATMILDEFAPRRVTVEVKKFVIPQASHVAVRLTRVRK